MASGTETVTVLFTDVVGSTELRTDRGDVPAHEIMQAHFELVRQQIEQHSGQEVKTIGDSFMVAFSSARRAVDCAMAVQQTLTSYNRDNPDQQVQVRIGLHTGEVIQEEKDLFGAAVDAAARIVSEAKGDQILISETVHSVIGPTKDVEFVDKGLFQLKGFPDRWRLYEIVWQQEEGLVAPALAKRTASKRFRLGITAAVVAALACLCIAVILLLRQPEPVESPISPTTIPVTPSAEILEEKAFSSIAVLPFVDMSADKDQEYFCDGMAEELINALTQLEDLRVIARTSAFSFKGKGMKISDIGKELNVGTILEGSVRKVGNRLRITAQLVNVADGYHLWSEKYDREMDDVFAIQDEISLAIVDKLKVKLVASEKARLAKRHTVDPEVYDLYLRGRYFLNKRTLEDMEKAIEYFKQAIEKDPDYALAYAELAMSYSILPIYNPSLPQKEAYAKAGEASLKALEIDDTLAEAHVLLAGIRMTYYLDWDGAEREYKRAIELNPGYADALFYYSHQLMIMGRFDEAMEEIKRARALDPFSLIINKHVVQMFLRTRQYDQAIESAEKVLEMAPNTHNVHLLIGLAYMGKSMYEEALAEFEAERQLHKVWNPVIESHIGITYARMARRVEAGEVLDDLLERSKEGYVPPTVLANVYFALGENDRGFEWLEKAYKERDLYLSFLKIDPAYDSIRSDPRYIAMLKKMGLDK